jgi:hypothetical protein
MTTSIQFEMDNFAPLLEKETFSTRFKQLLNQIKTDELNLEEVTAEVEAVRQAKYDLSQFNTGQGNYTKDRENLFANLTLEEIITDIKKIRNTQLS